MCGMPNASEQELLIEKAVKAKTKAELDDAEKAIDEWLQHNPDDTRVVAVGEKLSMKRAKLEDPERKLSRATVAIFLVVFLSVGVLGGWATGDWGSAAAIALMASLLVAAEVWEFVGGSLVGNHTDE